MPALVQVCIVIATIAVVAVAVTLVGTLVRLGRTAEDVSQLTRTARTSMAQVDLVAREAQAVVSALRECVPPVQRVLDRFEILGRRTADLSSVVLEEIETPVHAAAAVARGVTSGANHLIRRLVERFSPRNTNSYGGNGYE